MRPPETPAARVPSPRRRNGLIAVVAMSVLAIACTGSGGVEPPSATTAPVDETAQPAEPAAAAPTTTSSPATTTTTTTTIPASTPASTTTTTSRPPTRDLSPVESVARAKETASAIAVELTTYWEDDDHAQRLAPLVPPGEGDALVGAAAPLLHPGRWSYGEVTYPQMGGFDGERASVMVVTRQTVGSDDGAEFSVVRTLDIRLALGAADWEFEALASAGGAFEDLDDLRLAHRVADDPRIEMPDSARLDIREGQVSPVLLELMAELADQTPYGVVTLATGHPYHVFETDRVSHHSVGRAVDIYRIGDRRVFDDRDPGSTTQRITEWLLERDEVVQVGSPWDLDGEASRRSFADLVHQDHLHVAVRTEAELAERLDPAGEGGQEGSGG